MIVTYTKQILEICRRPKVLLRQVLGLVQNICGSIATWKLLIYYTGCIAPVIVVLSGSMEPCISRGDLLIVNQNPTAQHNTGDVLIFDSAKYIIPIIHRAHATHFYGNRKSIVYKTKPLTNVDHRNNLYKSLPDLKYLTKGDNNWSDDRSLYEEGEIYLNRADIVGKAVYFVPYAGILTVWLQDYILFKYLLLSVIILLLFLGRDVSKLVDSYMTIF